MTPAHKSDMNIKKVQYFLNVDFEPIKIIAKNYYKKVTGQETFADCTKRSKHDIFEL